MKTMHNDAFRVCKNMRSRDEVSLHYTIMLVI